MTEKPNAGYDQTVVCWELHGHIQTCVNECKLHGNGKSRSTRLTPTAGGSNISVIMEQSCLLASLDSVIP